MQWTEPAGKLLVVPEPRGAGSATDRPHVMRLSAMIREPQRRHVEWALVALALLPVTLLFGRFLVEMGTQGLLLPSVERRIGAEIRAPEVRAGGETRELMSFANVRPGACAAAGIVSGDII